MGGIVDIFGIRDALSLIIKGHSRFRIRGYDSAGMHYDDGQCINLSKTKGK